MTKSRNAPLEILTSCGQSPTRHYTQNSHYRFSLTDGWGSRHKYVGRWPSVSTRTTDVRPRPEENQTLCLIIYPNEIFCTPSDYTRRYKLLSWKEDYICLYGHRFLKGKAPLWTLWEPLGTLMCPLVSRVSTSQRTVNGVLRPKVVKDKKKRPSYPSNINGV